MSLRYSIQEAFTGLNRAKVSTLIAVTTVAFLLFIISVFGIVSLNVNRLIHVLNTKIDIQAFISNTLDDTKIANLGAKLINIEGVENVEYVSKEKAAKEFQKEFGDELFNILEDNPLPSSFNISLKDDLKNLNAIKDIAQQVEKDKGIDEVVYHSQALNILNRFSKIAKAVNIIVFSLVMLGSLFVISNTIRLIIMTRKHILETMKLVGATSAFVRLPLILEGVIQGLLGGIVAFLFVASVVKIIDWQWPGLVFISPDILVMLIVMGFLFGLAGSLIAIKRFL